MTHRNWKKNKIKLKFPAVNFVQTLNPDPGSGIRIRDPESGSAIRKMLVPDPYFVSVNGNPDPQH